MPTMRTIAEALDLLVKVGIAVVVGLFYGTAKEQAEIAGKQAEAVKNQTEAVKLQTEAINNLAQAQKTRQEANMTIIDKILQIFSDVHKECMTEERQYTVEFLIQVNNRYNDIQLDEKRLGTILSAQQKCLDAQGNVNPDAQQVAAVSGTGAIPFVTASNFSGIFDKLKAENVKVEAAPEASEKPDGYVAVGSYEPAAGFRNFTFVGGKPNDPKIAAATVIKARWSVYLRSNFGNTDSGGNPILGLIRQEDCVRVLASYPGVRGQTWAAVKLAPCPKA